MANSYITLATVSREIARLGAIKEFNRRQKEYYFERFNKYHRMTMRQGHQVSGEVLKTFYQEMFNHFNTLYFQSAEHLSDFSIAVEGLFPPELRADINNGQTPTAA